MISSSSKKFETKAECKCSWIWKGALCHIALVWNCESYEIMLKQDFLIVTKDLDLL